jgi:hypothetical protein
MQVWKPIQLSGEPEQDAAAIRLNSLGSLFFFCGYILKKDRLSRLHKALCKSLESEDLHAVIEMPMLHFKTTCANEGLSMWWALPFTERDEVMMRALGYGDEWIRWMRKAHDQNARTLITHETEDLAIKVGVAIDSHYQYNERFRSTFPEIIPTSESWSAHTKYHKRTDNSHTEGTYEYRGSGQSVQGLHMTGIIEDDNVGKAAQDSLNMGDGRVMESVIAYHRLVSSRYDPAHFTKTGLGRQLVIGNRWAPKDLNGWIRENQPEFTIERHSAEGGCCAIHPSGIPIFPEEFDHSRLATMKRTFGPVNYSHFFLNEAVAAEDYVFRKEWIRNYRFKPSKPDAPLDDPGNFLMIEHQVKSGEVIEDLACGALHIRMIIDLAHAKKRNRCKHVVLILGFDSESDRMYLLDVWADAGPYSTLVGKMYEMAKKWGLYECWLETVGAQNLLKFHIEEKNRSMARPLRVMELPYDNSENAKTNRIESMEPVYRSGNFWIHPSQTEFTSEYESYHARKTTDVDVLDTVGYAPKTLETLRRRGALVAMKQREEAFKSRTVSVTGY